MGCYDSGADDVIVFVSDEFDEAVFETVDLAGGGVGQ